MPHTVNRIAFLAAKNCGHPLLAAYGLLVATEIALKDHGTTWRKGHDIPQLLDQLNSPGLVALGAQLRQDIASILCTDQNGNPATARPQIYPDLRYARFSSDHSSGITTTEIQNIVKTIGDIITQLQQLGIAV